MIFGIDAKYPGAVKLKVIERRKKSSSKKDIRVLIRLEYAPDFDLIALRGATQCHADNRH